MHIEFIRVREFGTIDELEVDLSDSLNVISGPNEAGKSTLMRAVWFALTRKCSSRAQEIKDIEPNTGGTPQVEVSIRVGGSEYELSKTFDGQSGSTSLRVDHSNGGVEDYTGDEADEVIREALGFGEESGRTGTPGHYGFWPAVWVDQEDRQLDPGKHLSEEGNTESISSVLAQIGGDVLAGPGTEIVEKAEERYRNFYTKTGKVSKNSLLHNTQERSDDAKERRDELETRRDNYEDDLEEHERLNRELDTLDEQIPELKDETEEAQEEYERLQKLQDQLETENAKLETAQRTVDQLEEHQTRQESLREKIEEQKGRVEEKQAEIESRKATLESHREDRESLAREKEEAEEQRDDLQREVKRLQAHLDVLRQEERLQELEERAKKLENLTGERDEFVNKLSQIEVEENDVEELKTLKEGRDEARTRLQTAAAQLQFTATGKIDFQIDGENLTLSDGETEKRRVDAPTTIHLPSLQIGIEPGGEDLASIREAATSTQEEYEEALGDLGVESLAEARSQREERDRLGDRVESIKEQIGDLKPEDDDLQELKVRAESKVRNAKEKRSQLSDSEDEDSLPEEEGQVRTLLDETEKELEEATADLQDARDALSEHDERTQKLQERLSNAETEREGLKETLEATQDELDAHKKEHGSDEEIQEELDQAREELKGQRQEAEQIKSELDELSFEELEARKERTENALESTEEEREEAKEKLNKVEGRLESDELRGLHERLEEARQELDTAQAEVDRLRKQAEAAKLLYETLSECRAEARKKYLAPLREEAESLLSRFFDADESHVEFGEQFDIQKLSRSSEGSFSFDKLSTGARQQLSVLIRLAMARLIAQERPHPVFLDDALSDTDAERFEAIANILHTVSREIQIVLTTCHHDRYRKLGVGVKRMESLK